MEKIVQGQALFRFQDMEIWKMAIDVGDRLFDMVDDLERRRLFRFADQLRGSGLSVSNNIAEGSGSLSNREFRTFLGYARRSVYENANVAIVLRRRDVIAPSDGDSLLGALVVLSRMITAFRESL